MIAGRTSQLVLLFLNRRATLDPPLCKPERTVLQLEHLERLVLSTRVACRLATARYMAWL